MDENFFNPKNQVYGFAFTKNNISVRTLYKLKNVDCCYQVFGKVSIDGYIDSFLSREQPEYILGMGVYSGKDQDKIRIETKCTNKFRNGFMNGSQLEKIDIHPFLKPHSLTKYAEGLGNSYCNLVSWKIMSKIKNGELKSKYTFLHIPKGMNVWQVVEEIDAMLARFKQI
ncbi:hypothetical protein KKB40_01280 [Patescibacteria group bacterium]|nr:hypothetical protein [Patescibacteria group bacterium]